MGRLYASSMLRIVFVFVLALFASPPLRGHHSAFGRFDTLAVMTLEGTLVDVIWRNPHALLVVETEDGVLWMAETGPATQLDRSGVTRESVPVGNHLRLAGWPPLTAERELFVTNIELPSGEEVLLESSATLRFANAESGIVAYYDETRGDASRPDLGLFRVWSYSPESVFLFPEAVDLEADVNRYPMTPAAQLALRGFDRATDNPTRNCTPKGMPTIMEQPYPMEFVEAGDDILLRLEEYDTLRTIHMGAVATPADTTAFPLGYSVGEWDGATLVVRTTHLSWPWFNQLGVPQSPESELLERFTPTEDGSRLDYELTVTDPLNFTEPVTLERFWIYLPDVEVLPFECSETAYESPTGEQATSVRPVGPWTLAAIALVVAGALIVTLRRMRSH